MPRGVPAGSFLQYHLPTDQKVGSSNLPGRAIFFKDLINTQIFTCADRYTIGTDRPTFDQLF